MTALLNRHRVRSIREHENLSASEQHQVHSNLRDRAEEATRDPYVWVTEHTQTKNEHWVEEGRPTPYESFPRLAYLADVFELLSAERIIWLEKSRDLMLSWSCVAYLTLNAMRIPARGVLFQTQKDEKAVELVDYAKVLYEQQPDWLKEAFPLSKPLARQGSHILEFAHGGHVMGIPGDSDQVRSRHPWGYLLDEASFVVQAGECFNESLSAVKGKIILNSSAGPSWFADARRDIIRNEDD